MTNSNLDKKHLFILGHPASGSTLLNKLVGTSNACSIFDDEGQFLAGNEKLLATNDRWNPEKNIDWDSVKKIWQLFWKKDKSILVEKSPPHLVRAKQLSDNFDSSYFIILIRNPYAYVEGARRRRNINVPVNILIRRWIFFAIFQKKNIENLKNATLLTYEELTGDTQITKNKLITFLPELSDIKIENEFKVFDRKSTIFNKNEIQIANLSDYEISLINNELNKFSYLLNYFNYNLINMKHEKFPLKEILKNNFKHIHYYINKKEHFIDTFSNKYLRQNYLEQSNKLS